MPNKKFFISWLVSSVYMYAVSYVWHGIVLNDLERLTYPKNMFLLLAAMVYLGLGLALTLAIHYIHINKPKVFRGLFFGVAIGGFVYLIAFVFGISFHTQPKILHVAMDLTWQIIEQATGGLISAWVFRLVQIQERIAKQFI